MMTALTRLVFPWCTTTWLLLILALPVRAQEVAAFELQLDETIRAACHGYMVDALPSSLSWLRDQIHENSPFCQRTEAARNEDEINDALQEAHRSYRSTHAGLDRQNEVDRRLNVTIECDAEYMCMEVRLNYQDTSTPVSQHQYESVRDFCQDRYGCIQNWFREWPRALPEAGGAETIGTFTFDQLLAEQDQSTPPEVPPTSIEDATVVEESPERASEPVRNVPQADPQAVQLSAAIGRLCRCSFSGNACIDNPYGPVKEQVARVEAQRLGYCRRWKSDLLAQVQSSAGEDSGLIEQLAGVQADIARADARAQAIVQLVAEDFQRIRERVRRNQPFVATLELDRINALVAEGDTQAAADTRTQPASEAGVQQTEKGFLVGPRLDWESARRYCAQRGMRLPTVAEARAKRDQFGTDDFWGVWTSELRMNSGYGPWYETMRWNGHTEMQLASREEHTVCFR